MNFIFGTKSE